MTTTFTPNLPGIFRIPAEVYHSSPGVSNSMLSHMDPPARLPVYLKEKRDPTDAMLLGTLVHSRILEPHAPLPGIAVVPATYLDKAVEKPWNFNATYCKNWRTVAEDLGKLILKQEAIDNLLGCVDAIRNDDECARIFKEGEAELSVFTNTSDALTSAFCKARIDWLPAASNALVDVKKVRSGFGSPEAFSKLLVDRALARQAAWYLDLWNSLMGTTDRRETFVFVVVEEEPPYLVSKYVVAPEALEYGRREYQLRLESYARCVATGKWPGYSRSIEPITLPDWKLRKESL